MNRNSKSNEQDSQPGRQPGRQPGIDENLRDGSSAGSLKTGSFDDLNDLEGWSREDFEAALPLYVGGDLDAQEAARVDAWLIAHPEDHDALTATKQAAAVLARYAEFTKERETPDLWTGIRSELMESGALEPVSTSHTGSSKRSGHERPILGGPRWFQRKGVAAAAALLLTGSVGLFMMSRGAATDGGEMIAPVGTPSIAASGMGSAMSSASAVADSSSDVASLPGEELLSGEAGTAERPLVSIPVGMSLGRHPRDRKVSRGKSQKLQLAQQGAERLIDDAPKALLWQIDPWVQTNQGLIRSNSNDTQLTGGR